MPDPEIARWLSAFEEVRRDTLALLAAIPPDGADRDLGDGGDSVGTVLYHVALVEVDWVDTDVLGEPERIPADRFPHLIGSSTATSRRCGARRSS